MPGSNKPVCVDGLREALQRNAVERFGRDFLEE